MVRLSSRLLGERYPLVRFVLVESSTPHDSEDYKGSAISLDTCFLVGQDAYDREKSRGSPISLVSVLTAESVTRSPDSDMVGHGHADESVS